MLTREEIKEKLIDIKFLIQFLSLAGHEEFNFPDSST